MTHSLSDEQFAELHDLITARLTEQITRTQMSRLETLINENPEARRVYVQYMRDTVMLHCLGQEEEGQDADTSNELRALRESLLAQRFGVEGEALQFENETAGQVTPMPAMDSMGNDPSEAPTKTMRLHKLPPRNILAAALIGVSMLGVLIYMLMPGDPPSPPQPVATLTESHHATWEDKDGRLIFIRDGKALPPQSLYLADGLAKLMFKDGAVVLLDATINRVRFDVLSSMEGFLHVGKITARAESDSAKGFTVGVPGSQRVVDVSTAFGIIVDDDGHSEVHVLDGAVDVEQETEDGQIQSVRMSEGQAARLDVHRLPIQLINETLQRFVTAMPEPPKPEPPTPKSTVASARNSLGKTFNCIEGGLVDGTLVYTDRIHRWRDIPSDLKGADLFQLANSDKTKAGVSIFVEVTQPATLYVLWNPNAPLQNWLKRDFKNTGQTIGVDRFVGPNDPVIRLNYLVWKREVKAGAVTLGPSDAAVKSGLPGIAIVPSNDAAPDDTSN